VVLKARTWAAQCCSRAESLVNEHAQLRRNPVSADQNAGAVNLSSKLSAKQTEMLFFGFALGQANKP